MVLTLLVYAKTVSIDHYYNHMFRCSTVQRKSGAVSVVLIPTIAL